MKRHHPAFIRRFAILAFGALAWAGAARAQETPAPPAAADAPESAQEAVKDPKAIEILRGMYEYQNKLSSYSFTGDMKMKMSMQGMNMDMPMKVEVKLQKPNKMFARTTGEGMAAMSSTVMVSDGKTMYVYVPASNSWFEQPAPEEITQAPGTMSPLGGGMGSPVGGSADPDEAIAKLISAQYIGLEDVNGQPMHHVKTVSAEGGVNMGMDLWIQDGGQPLARKAVPDFSNFAEILTGATGGDASMAEMMGDVKMEAVITYDNWELNPQFPEDQFKFTPPPGAQKASDDMMSLLGGGMGGGLLGGGTTAPVNTADQSGSLVGKPAPTFTARLTSGKDFKLSETAGKPVALVFWASWNEGSAAAIRKTAEVTGVMGEKAPFTLLINQTEDAKTVAEFLKQNGLKATAALDESGDIGAKYGLTKLPMLVIIDTAGKVNRIFSAEDLRGSFQTDLRSALQAAASTKP